MLIFYQVGEALHERLMKHSEPYRNPRIINVIHNMYFTGGVSSFTTHFNHLFLCFRDSQGAMKAEVPQPMVALVATAVISLLSYTLMSKLNGNLAVLSRV